MSTEDPVRPPVPAGPATTGPATTGPATAAPHRPEPEERSRGPHAPSVVLGLAVLLVAGLVATGVLTDVRVDTGAVAGCALVVLGALLALGGALAGARRR